MYDFGFQQQIERETRAREIAREILGVDEGASARELKRAWRSLAMKHHPDRNRNDQDAGKKLATINCAYNLLAHGKPCETILTQEKTRSGAPEHDKYRLDNAWGLFLWWRERYF